MKSIKHFSLVLLLISTSIHIHSQVIETIEIRPGPENGFDAEVRTDMNHPIWIDDDFISNAWTVGGNPFIQRSLIKFDLTSIPDGAEIVNARLSLFCNTTSGHQQLHAGYNASFLYTIISEWDQHQVVWDNQPSTTNEDAILLPQSDYQTQDYTDIDVTSQITHFYQNPGLNFGFMLQLAEENQYAAMVFASSNHLNPDKRPLLVIDYISCMLPDTNFSYNLMEDGHTMNFTLEPNANNTYWWNFGNGFYSDLPQPTFTFQESGDYSVCLTVKNDCDTLTNCKVVNVCDLVNNGFNYQVDETIVSFFQNTLIEGVQYLWDFGDGFLSSLPEPIHMFNLPGHYQVCSTISNECNSLTVCDTLNIVVINSENFDYDKSVTLFPNPTNGILYIAKSDINLIIKSVTVFSIIGNLEIEFKIFCTVNNKNLFNFDLSSLTNGVYTVLIETNKGAISKEIVLLN